MFTVSLFFLAYLPCFIAYFPYIMRKVYWWYHHALFVSVALSTITFELVDSLLLVIST